MPSRSLPYALARFGVLLAASVCVILWLVVTFGGDAFLGAHIASAFGWSAADMGNPTGRG